MQKITRNTLSLFAVWIVSLFFVPLGKAKALDLAEQDDTGLAGYEVWQASSNDYTFLQFLAEVFYLSDQNENTTKETKQNTIQLTENAPKSSKFTNH